jgi:hypothetical protein
VKISLKNIIESYNKKFRDDELEELAFFQDLTDLEEAIEKASMAVDKCGKRQKHQRTFQKKTLRAARNKLTARKTAISISKAKDFDQLYKIVEEAVLQTPGINELYVYDTALRIGAHRKFLPDKVYLHRGTRIGARRLGIKGKGPIELCKFPPELRSVPAHQVEDILCIFRDYLAPFAAGPKQRNSESGSVRKTKPPKIC